MHGIILYKSKYGSTECYAQWLAEKTHFDVCNVKNIDLPRLGVYDTVVFCSPVYIGRILLAKWIKKHWELVTQKKKYLLVVGSTNKEDTDAIEKIITANFDEKYLLDIAWFYVMGKANVEKLSFKDKSLTSVVARFEEDEKVKSMLLNGFDCMDVHNLEPLCHAIGKE